MKALLAVLGGFVILSCTPTVKEVALKKSKGDIVLVQKGGFLFTEEEENFIRQEAKRLGIAIPDNRDIELHLKRFLRHRASLEVSLKRANLYIPYIRDILLKYGLPEELSLLPLIESGFNPFAVSSSGAGGIWQLMPATARRYGLKVDGSVDERFDLFKSTHAAARYLRDLYRRFGDWSLVLAAYNCGEGCVSRRTGGVDFWRSKWALPEQTRKYVPMFFAALLIAKSPDKYGLRVSVNSITIKSKTIKAELPVSKLLSMYSLKESTFRDMNPHIKGSVIPAGAQVYLPKEARIVVKYAKPKSQKRGKPKIRVVKKVAKLEPPEKRKTHKKQAPQKKVSGERIVIKGSGELRRTRVITLDNGALLYIKE